MTRYSFPALLLTALILTTAGCNQRASSSSSAPAPLVGAATKSDGAVAPAGPKVALQTLDWDGLQQLLAGHRGKVVVLDCWSTSCAPCIREFPNLVALQQKHDRNELACVSLSFDYEGTGRPEDEHQRVLAFLQKQQATFDNVLSSLDSDTLMTKLDIPSIPAVFIYDRQGRLHRRFDNRHASRTGGPFTYEQVSAVVEDLLGGRAGSAE